MEVYSAIKVIARQRNISIYRIEHDLGLTSGIISKWDNAMPSADKLQAVSDYLGVTSAYILNKSKEIEVI
ncbi:transcriptional regulator [Secundilactobacillus pentosiphilus]|uniref:Transcriptional regulator n=1 Tax=Secundilactobacillus pentosiphilus TaxID=1714682 RepID=A0A1Z5IYZ1_9LACO|nr:helix-turn-helix domain-containing protein [Secundilactobacillus pentosiphilus]GAX06987.1 transcriptional regulator [Secundilactobacillus pentosiphilus]